MPFRWQGKYLFLTYPRSNFNHDEFISFIRSKGGRHVAFIRVVSELHDDGGPHRHSFIAFSKRFSFESESRFDFAGHHPSIERKVRDPAASLRYCGNPDKPGYVSHTDWGEIPDFDKDDAPRESRQQLWGRLLDEATSASQFLQSVRENAPYDFATRYQQLEGMATAVFRQRTPYSSPHEFEDFALPDTIEGWLEKEFDQEVSYMA